MTSRRRDYRRWEPWMGYFVTVLLFFVCAALLASGHLVAGPIWGLAAVGNAVNERRKRH